jgi:hypothetical protein
MFASHKVTWKKKIELQKSVFHDVQILLSSRQSVTYCTNIYLSDISNNRNDTTFDISIGFGHVLLNVKCEVGVLTTEAKFLDVTGTKVLRVFILAIQSHIC